MSSLNQTPITAGSATVDGLFFRQNNEIKQYQNNHLASYMTLRCNINETQISINEAYFVTDEFDFNLYLLDL